MRAMKAVYGLWENIQIGQLNKLLKPFGCRLVKKTSKHWGAAVSVTAHALEASAAPMSIRPPVQDPLGNAVPERCLEENHVWLPPNLSGIVFCSVCHWEQKRKLVGEPVSP